MPQVMFYLLEQDEIDQQPAALALAGLLVQRSGRGRQSCLVMCESKTQAEALDEYLWRLPVSDFVPHNLVGEGPRNGTSVIVAWPQSGLPRTDVVINLCPEVPEQCHRARRVFDFVPSADAPKQLARERYKHYRAAGAQLRTEPAAALIESNHG